MTQPAILYADRGDRRKSPGVPATAIFADRSDQRIKLPISGMPPNNDVLLTKLDRLEWR